jgi:hypothetical protein
MIWPFNKPFPDGSPWLDYKESVNTGAPIYFYFKIEDFLKFILKEICVTFPAGSQGVPRTFKVSAHVISSVNLLTPIPIQVELISSPSQDFRQGTLNEDISGGRFEPLVFSYPCEAGDVLRITVEGERSSNPDVFTIGCMIHGRKYGGGV